MKRTATVLLETKSTKKSKSTKTKRTKSRRIGDPSNNRYEKLYFSGNVREAALPSDGLHSFWWPVNDLTAVTGIEPMGRDQLFGMYEEVFVKSVRAKYKTNCGTDNVNLQVCSWYDTNPSASTSGKHSAERCLSFGGNVDYVMLAGEQEMPFRSIYGSARKLQLADMKESDARCTAGTAPASMNLWYWHLEVNNLSTTAVPAAAGGLNISYYLEFDTVWIKPANITTS